MARAASAIGTLTIQGDLTLSNSSIVNMRVDGSGNSDLIAVSGTAHLAGTLQLTPGMTLNMIGPDVGHPTAYNEGMRGLPTTETRMLVLMDGVPVNDPFFGYIQWNRIPLDNIEQVEIVRGGGSPLFKLSNLHLGKRTSG